MNELSKLVISILLLALVSLACVAESTVQIKKEVTHPGHTLQILYYDADFLFVGRNFGSKRTLVTEPGFFIHVKSTDSWYQLTGVSSINSKLGSSHGEMSAEEKERMRFCSVSWDHRGLKDQAYVSLPLRTSGSISFPDKVEFDESLDTYTLRFFTSWNIEAVETSLQFRKKDLVEAITEK